jgi:hypothetical protein
LQIGSVAAVHARLLAFGHIEIDGKRIAHDVVVEGDRVRKRKKGPSKPYRGRFGHTPLSLDESIPWSRRRLVIGTGAAGQMPVMDEVFQEARRRGVEIVARPTSEACQLLTSSDGDEVAAILHVTC